jgi:Flp pilus assembly protein TadG
MNRRTPLRALLSDSRGNVLVLSALAMPLMIGAAGLAMDTVQLTLIQRQLQRQADSAALAGALARAQGAAASPAATSSITRDSMVALSKAPVIENGPTKGSYAGNTGAVRVVIESTQTQVFADMFRDKPATLRVEATAASMTNGNYCVVSLEKSAAVGINLQGNAGVDMGCGLATNSKGSPAVTTGGSSTVKVSHVAAVGGLKSSVNYSANTVLLPYAIPQKDPYASLPTPTVPAGCSAQLNVQPNAVMNVSNPSGTACYRGMNIKGTVTFASGTYIIDGGSVSLGAQAVVNGTGVTFILTSATAASNASSVATLDMNGGARVNLTATTSGTYAGVLFYQDRRAAAGTTNTVNGNAVSKFQGGFYFASQDLSFSGDSGMTTDCVQLVSRRVTFIGNTRIVNVCPVDSGAGSFIGTRVFLVG